MITDTQAAELALMCAYAMDAYQVDRSNLAPTPDPRLSPKWRVIGYLTGTDAILRIGRTVAFGADVNYGYVAQLISQPNVFVAAIRGTEGIVEWLEDGQFLSIPHPTAGRVEAGFWGVYSSMTYRPIAGGAVSAALGLVAAIGDGQLIVLGHSLGSALATYLTFDLATELGTRVQACLFASPRPGNSDFVKAFDSRVTNYVAYAYALDVVPRIPVGPDYDDLPRTRRIGIDLGQAKIRLELACFHHVVCYSALLDYSLLDWMKLPIADQKCAACIRGPVAKLISAART